MTLEDALQEIIKLKETNKELQIEIENHKNVTTQKDKEIETLKEGTTKLNANIDKLNKLNMDLFLKVDQTFIEPKEPQKKEDEENEIISEEELINKFWN